MKKTILKLGVLSFFLFGAFFINVSEVEADCNLTTTKGTDGRGFLKVGEFACLERDEDTTCFIPDDDEETDPDDPVIDTKKFK
jgi:hypothetical protein